MGLVPADGVEDRGERSGAARYGVKPATIERNRWLIVALAAARGTPGGHAIAKLARHGYSLDIV